MEIYQSGSKKTFEQKKRNLDLASIVKINQVIEDQNKLSGTGLR